MAAKPSSNDPSDKDKTRPPEQRAVEPTPAPVEFPVSETAVAQADGVP